MDGCGIPVSVSYLESGDQLEYFISWNIFKNNMPGGYMPSWNLHKCDVLDLYYSWLDSIQSLLLEQ